MRKSTAIAMITGSTILFFVGIGLAIYQTMILQNIADCVCRP